LNRPPPSPFPLLQNMLAKTFGPPDRLSMPALISIPPFLLVLVFLPAKVFQSPIIDLHRVPVVRVLPFSVYRSPRPLFHVFLPISFFLVLPPVFDLPLLFPSLFFLERLRFWCCYPIWPDFIIFLVGLGTEADPVFLF